jgi:hypothetical protein
MACMVKVESDACLVKTSSDLIADACQMVSSAGTSLIDFKRMKTLKD